MRHRAGHVILLLTYWLNCQRGLAKSISGVDISVLASTATKRPIITATPIPDLCFINGHVYLRNSNFTLGYKASSKRCSVAIIDENCHMTIKDNSICVHKIATPENAPQTTTHGTPVETTTPPMRIPLCHYKGRVLSLGDVIPSDSKWCSGVKCTDSGLYHWDNFNCSTTIIRKTVTTPTLKQISDRPKNGRMELVKMVRNMKMTKRILSREMQMRKMSKIIKKYLMLLMWRMDKTWKMQMRLIIIRKITKLTNENGKRIQKKTMIKERKMQTI